MRTVLLPLISTFFKHLAQCWKDGLSYLVQHLVHFYICFVAIIIYNITIQLRINNIYNKAATIKQTSVGKFEILSSRHLLGNFTYYQADVCWEISNTIKQTSVGKFQILSNRRLLANFKYYQADVCWQILNTIKQTSVGQSQILLVRRLLLKRTNYKFNK